MSVKQRFEQGVYRRDAAAGGQQENLFVTAQILG